MKCGIVYLTQMLYVLLAVTGLLVCGVVLTANLPIRNIPKNYKAERGQMRTLKHIVIGDPPKNVDSQLSAFDQIYFFLSDWPVVCARWHYQLHSRLNSRVTWGIGKWREIERRFLPFQKGFSLNTGLRMKGGTLATVNNYHFVGNALSWCQFEFGEISYSNPCPLIVSRSFDVGFEGITGNIGLPLRFLSQIVSSGSLSEGAVRYVFSSVSLIFGLNRQFMGIHGPIPNLIPLKGYEDPSPESNGKHSYAPSKTGSLKRRHALFYLALSICEMLFGFYLGCWRGVYLWEFSGSRGVRGITYALIAVMLFIHAGITLRLLFLR
jgi:hypothetical protein